MEPNVRQRYSSSFGTAAAAYAVVAGNALPMLTGVLRTRRLGPP